MTKIAKVQTFDVIIVGAGPAGLSFARTLVGSGLNVAVVERQSRAQLADPAIDGRDIALTQRSEATMRELGIWQHMPGEEIAFIRHAKVINGKTNYALHFDHRETGADYLGPIVGNDVIRRA
ncbi:MAG: FAD-dependent oxidoreductase, partial [Rhodospirillaceae bacterium]|nr:FAD-dependent oxidoreductase [Rhodospirillaceae bacterium]